MNQSAILQVHNLNIKFGEVTAVESLSFDLSKGKTLAIVGESGSGKSVTAFSLLGLLPEYAKVSGEVKIDGKVYQHKDWASIRGNVVSMIFQEPMSSLNPVMTIGKQLEEAIRTHQKISKDAARLLAIDWLGKVKLPAPKEIYGRYPHQLSGGQKQRVMIAMAMCNHPDVLIADEPTTALDVTVEKEIVDLISSLQQEENMSVIFITHDLALASSIADDVLVMYRGKQMEYGAAQKVLNSPEHPYTKALLACRPNAEHKNNKLLTVSDFWKEGVEVEPNHDSITYPTIASEENILEVNNLNIWFPDKTSWLGKTETYFKAVNGVSFDLKKGEVLGLVGESGCGKSTISKSLMGLLPVKEGQIIYEGRDLAKISEKEWASVRTDIQMIFQDPYSSLNPRMRVGDLLKETLHRHHIVPPKEIDAEVERLLGMVHLPADSIKRYPHQFSGGQRQRIGIARALSVRPKLLICDECVSALDVSVQAQILNLLKELQIEQNLSYLFISHDLNVVHYISDRVLVMEKGVLVEKGKAEQVLKSPKHPYTQKLVAAVPQ